jgi:hypothetical protein
MIGNDHILTNRALAPGLIDHDDRRPPETTSRLHTALRSGGALFLPLPDSRTEPPALDLDQSVRRRQVLAFGAAVWAAQSA